MRRAIDYGQKRAEYEVEPTRLLGRFEPVIDQVEVRSTLLMALEEPYNFPALERALTPGDRITVVVDETLPSLVELLIPLLEQIMSVGIHAADITLLCPPSSRDQPWLEGLPEHLEEVQLEVHDPGNRKKLSYLATLAEGRRLYLNRTLVDADQAIILSARRYDPLHGYGGAEGAIYPAFGDEETEQAFHTRLSLSGAGGEPWPARREAVEAAWLLGLPFFVQVIEGAGDRVAAVVAGAKEASIEAERLLDRRWRQTVGRPAHLVVAGLSGDPARHTFADIAAAAACAARVVQPGGRIVILTDAKPELGPEIEPLQGHEEPENALVHLRKNLSVETLAAVRWAAAGTRARLYLLSGLESQQVEDLWATPLSQASQVQKLIDIGGDTLFLDDAHRTLAVVDEKS